MTKLTKTAVTLATMNANADKPMAEVVELIVTAQHAAGFTDVTAKIAVGAYRWAVKNGKAEGKLTEKVKAEPKAKVAKAPKVRAAKTVSVATTRKARIVAEAAVDGKSAADVEAIRAANLVKIKAVHEKMIARGQLPGKAEVVATPRVSVDDEVEAERDYPAFLTVDQLDEIL